ncbi:hypothetical protein HDU76_009778 [Blyttiomyces sp. JEL0837]|nr:hypothetical protein HDU76_009778 [Blyttiomyces sp. JEL0837]
MTDSSPLYPSSEAFNSGFLSVSSIHTIAYSQYGNPKGNAVIYVHGGPGGGTSPDDSRYFDPTTYRIVLFDQRGAGKSTPPAELRENDTWSLVSDMERIREHLGIDKWVVFGGSWGSTLALAYAIKHADRVKALIVRGIFTLRKSEIKWFYQEGASHIFPDAWEPYVNAIPVDERDDFITAYYKRLTSEDPAVRRAAAGAWSTWEMATSKLYTDPELIKKAENDTWADQFARIECHYFINKGFFETDEWILENVDKIRHIPAVIVQGRYDVVCPVYTAWALHKRWPESELHIITDAGHSAKEKGTTQKLVEAAEKFKNL